MNPLRNRIYAGTLTFGAVLALSCAMAQAQSDAAAPAQSPYAGQSQPDMAQDASGPRSDGQVEMDVVHALDASDALKNDMITAATIQGEVTLSGTVSSAASSQLAESISRHVAGVTKVHNNLQVGNPQDAQSAAGAADASAQQAADDGQADAAPAQTPQPPSPGQGQASGPNPPQPGAYPPPAGQYPPQQAGNYPPPPPGYPPPPGSYPYPPPPARAPYPYGQQPGYPLPPQQPSYALPKGPVTVPQGTLIQARTAEAVDGKHAKDGQTLSFTLIRDVTVNGVLAIPRGATLHGVITEDKQAGVLAGSPVLALKLTSLDLGGQSYAFDSDEFKVKGPNKAGHTVGNAVGGAILGAIIGGAIDRGPGAAIGAAAGAGAGTAASAATPGPRMWIPMEALVTFHVNAPITVNPVTQEEASRLSQGLYQGGPALYRRGYYGYGYPYPPPIYYRPYYMAGGYYYWR